MTQRDFELIARVIATSAGQDRDVLAERFADALAQTNGRFQRATFLRACGHSGYGGSK